MDKPKKDCEKCQDKGWYFFHGPELKRGCDCAASMENWPKKLARIHYEPNHEEGVTCWCKPTTAVEDGTTHIVHIPQRQLLMEFVEELLSSEKQKMVEEVRELKSEYDPVDTSRLVDFTPQQASIKRRQERGNLAVKKYIEDRNAVIDEILALLEGKSKENEVSN